MLDANPAEARSLPEPLVQCLEVWDAFLKASPLSVDLVSEAIATSQRYLINYWDAALLAAAERLEAPVLYTEDLNHQQKYGSVTVINPFRPQ